MASFALTRCQLGTESIAGTAGTVSSAEMEMDMAPSKEYKPQNSDKVTKPGVPQNENEIETNQSEQTVSELKITAEGTPVEVRLASDGQIQIRI